MISTKYDNVYIDNDAYINNLIRLTNQIWKLIPMRENNEDWTSHLTIVTNELAGFFKILNLDNLILLSKLEGLRTSQVDFYTYRAIVFRCIRLLNNKEIVNHE